MEPPPIDTIWHFVAAGLELSAQERTKFLTELRVNRPNLAAEVERLLTEQDAMGSFLSDLPLEEALLAGPGSLSAGTVVDKYRVVRHLASGGMGNVYLANRIEDFTSVVALKIVRSDRTTAELLDAFRRERQTLADLNSDHIVRIIDAGTHTDGRLFLVMDFVDGIPIDEYCRLHHVSRRGALRLFMPVLEAISKAHAHVKTITHADIKSGHLLVNNDGVVKVLDFGIATRGMDPASPMPFVPPTACTSPEQRAGDRPTAASDVYALGRVLQVLLDVAGHESWLDRITGRSTIGTARQEESRVRGQSATPSGLRTGARLGWFGQLRSRELDAIVNKATLADPHARYQSAGSLADDVKHYLEFKSTSGYQGHGLYRSAKWAVRHPVFSSGAVVVALLLVWGGRAAHTRTLARAERMATGAGDVMAEDPHRALRLAYDASEISTSPTVINALRQSIGNDLIGTFRSSTGNVRRLAFSHDGRLLAATSDTGSIQLWRVATGEVLAQTTIDVGHDIGVRFSVNDRFLELYGTTDLWLLDLAHSDMSFDVRLESFSPNTFKFVSPSGWLRYNGPARAIAFSDDEQRAAISVGNELRWVSLPRWTEMKRAVLGVRYVSGLTFADGDRLLIAGLDDGELQVWRAPFAKTSTIRPHTAPILQVRPLPHQTNLIATAAEDGTLAVTDTDTKTVLTRRPGRGPKGAVTSLDSSDDTNVLLIGHQDGYVGLWRWRDAASPLWFRPHSSRITRASIDALGQWVATEAEDGTVRVWDSHTGATELWLDRRQPDLENHQGFRVSPLTAVPRVKLSRRLDTTDTSEVLRTTYTKDNRSSAVVAVGPQSRIVADFHGVLSASLSSDGKLAAVVERSGHLGVWSVQDRRRLVWRSNHSYREVEFAPSGRLLLCFGGNSNDAEVLDGASGAFLGILAGSDRWRHIAFTDDARFVVAAFPREVRVWDLRRRALIFRQRVSSSVASTAVDSQHGVIAVADGDPVIHLSKIKPSVVLDNNQDTHPGSESIAMDPTGRYLGVTRSGAALIWDLANRTLILKTTDVDSAARLTPRSFDPTGPRLIVPNSDHGLTVWDLTRATVRLRCCQSQTPVETAIYAPNGAFIVTQTRNGESVAWQSASGVMLRRFGDGGSSSDPVSRPSISISHDSQLVATAVVGELRVDRVDSQTPQRSQARGDRTIAQAAFSPTSSLLATVWMSAEDYLDHLDLLRPSMKQPLRLDRRSSIDSVAFSPSGRLLVSGGAVLQIWDTDNGARLMQVQDSDETFSDFEFTADERFLVATIHTSLEKYRVRVLDLWGGTPPRDLPGFYAAIVPDGSVVAVTSIEGVELYETLEFAHSLSVLQHAAKDSVERFDQAKPSQ